MTSTQTTSILDVPDDVVKRLERALADPKPADLGRGIARLLIDNLELFSALESYFREQLRSPDRQDRTAAAVAFQAIPLAARLSADDGKTDLAKPAPSQESLAAIVAALVVEVELSVRFELLSALAAQDYEAAGLGDFARLAGLVAERSIESNMDLDEDTRADLQALHDRLRAAELIDSGSVLSRPEARRIVGYAATGIPFVLEDKTRPEVILIYNSSLDAWLPPGGHFNPGMDQLPSETLIHKIKDEAGADSIVYWAPGLAFASGSHSVQLHPSPSFVLLEDLTKHPRRNPAEVHSHHYDLNYICQISASDLDGIGHGTKPALRVSLGELSQAADLRAEVTRRITHEAKETHPRYANAGVFPDVVERIVLSLAVLAGEWNDKLNSFELNGSSNGQGAPHITQVDFPVAASGGANGR